MSSCHNLHFLLQNNCHSLLQFCIFVTNQNHCKNIIYNIISFNDKPLLLYYRKLGSISFPNRFYNLIAIFQDGNYFVTLLLSLLLLFCFWLLSHNLCETVGKWSGIGVTSATTALLSLCLLVTYLGHYFVQLVSAPTFTVSMEALIKSVAILRKKKKTIIAVR